MGYVYLIEDIDNMTYKIGVTKKNPTIRLKELQTGNSTKLNIKSIYEYEYPYRLESMLHHYYKKYCELNEWFSIPDDILKKFNDTCEMYDDIIHSLKDNPFFKKTLK